MVHAPPESYVDGAAFQFIFSTGLLVISMALATKAEFFRGAGRV